MLRNDNIRKIDIDIPKIIGHKGEVLDFDFCPFDDDIVVTGSEDR